MNNYYIAKIEDSSCCVNPIYTPIIHRLYIGSTHVDIDHNPIRDL